MDALCFYQDLAPVQGHPLAHPELHGKLFPGQGEARNRDSSPARHPWVISTTTLPQSSSLVSHCLQTQPTASRGCPRSTEQWWCCTQASPPTHYSEQSPLLPSPQPTSTTHRCQHLHCKLTACPNCCLLPADPIQRFRYHPLPKYLFWINWPEDRVACICLDYFLPRLTSTDIIFFKGNVLAEHQKGKLPDGAITA